MDPAAKRWWRSDWMFFGVWVVGIVTLNVSLNAEDPTLHTATRITYYVALVAIIALTLPRWRRWQPPWRGR